MIDIDKIREEFEVKVTDALCNNLPMDARVPIEYENVEDSDNLSEAKRNKSMWARITIREGEAITASLGDNVLRRFTGIAVISLFSKIGTGTKLAREKATLVIRYVLNNPISNAYIFTPYFSIIGKDGDWFQTNINIPFNFDQLTK